MTAKSTKMDTLETTMTCKEHDESVAQGPSHVTSLGTEAVEGRKCRSRINTSAEKKG